MKPSRQIEESIRWKWLMAHDWKKKKMIQVFERMENTSVSYAMKNKKLIYIFLLTLIDIAP